MATESDFLVQSDPSKVGRWKVILGVILTLAVVIVLAPPPKTERRFPGRIKVVFWHQFAGEWLPLYEGMVQRFNDSQTKYEVVPVSVPSDACTVKFLLSSAGGDTPDLLLDWDPILGMWSNKGLIQPFDNLMSPKEKSQYLAQTYPIVQKNGMYDGKIMAMIDGLDFWAVYYRLDHLKEIGVDSNHLPQTLEELVELGKKLDRYDDQKHLRRVGFLPQTLLHFAPAYGGSFNKDGRIVVDTPENLKAMTFLSEAPQRYGYDAISRFTSSLAADAGPTMPLIAGNYSIMYDGEWRVKQVAQYKPDLPYLVAPLPPPKGGRANSSMTAPNYLVIPTAAKHPEGAWEFAKFCVGFLHPEEGGRHMGEMGWIPDDPYIAKSKAYRDYLKKYPQYKVFVDLMSSPNLGVYPQGPLQRFVDDELDKADDSVLRGTLSPKKALEAVEQHLNEERTRLKRLGQSTGEPGER